MNTDEYLLRAWVAHRDPASFAALAERHAALVYGTCRRITGDPHAAEDLTQEVLLDLARRAGRVRRSVAGFLHAAARSRALNHCRDRETRQRHERAAGAAAAPAEREGDWARLEPLLDAALADLPADERSCICLHFLEGRSQEAVARALGIGQATVSRRLDTGLQRLRRRLGTAGLVLGLNGLTALCRTHAAESVPTTVTAAIPKLGLAATASGGATVAAGGLAVWSLAVVTLVAAVLTAILIDFTPNPPTTVASSPVDSGQQEHPMPPATNVRQDDQLIHLDPIPRFPRRVVRVDDQGTVLAREEEPPWRDHMIGCLWTALRMRGVELSWERVFAASGRAWRLAIADDTWSHDAELVSAVDEIEALTRALDLRVQVLRDRPLAETLAAIEAALVAGRPVVTGLGDPRFWSVIVGLDRARQEYLVIGGAPHREWTPLRLAPDAPVPAHLAAADCRRVAMPTQDWVAGWPGPEQLARNAVIVVDGAEAASTAHSIAATLRLAVDLATTRRIPRAPVSLHAQIPPDTDFPRTSEPGQFLLGNAMLRHWADGLAALARPTHDFRILHATDTTLGMQLRTAEPAAAFLRWAATRVEPGAAAHLIAAAADLAIVDADILCGGCGYLPVGDDPELLRDHMAAHPAIASFASPEQRQALETLGLDYRRCPWGVSVLPEPVAFRHARDLAVARLRRIADGRDAAIGHLTAAVAALERRVDGTALALTDDTCHLAPGDNVAKHLRQLPGTVQVWRDPVAYGPVAPGDDYYRIHAPALVPPVPDRQQAEARLRRWDAEAIAAIRAAPQTVLWFDACLYDTVQAMRLLALLDDAAIDPARLWFIQAGATPERGPIHGLGELTSAELEALLPEAHRLSPGHFARARQVWQAYAGDDPRAVAAVLPAADPGHFPHLEAALRRHLERFPATTDGLSTLERHALRAIAAGKHRFPAMFAVLGNHVSPAWYGDTYLADLLRDLSRPPAPLLTVDGASGEPRDWTLDLTPAGEAVLAGERDALEGRRLERWIGGVHLQGVGAHWRWDPSNERVVAP